LGQKSTPSIRETAMQGALTAAQEAEARELAQAIAVAAQADLLEVARTLVGSTPATLFGANEFKIRDIILRVAATAYEQHLAQKKTATKGPV
jgi:hypothetical protein